MLTQLIDSLINLLKWPIALISLFMLPAVLLTLGDQLPKLSAALLIPLAIGFAAYWLLWRFLFTRRLWGSWLPTFEHELIHTLFALFTLHKVTDFHTSYAKGGHVQYMGGNGNWLITISPYFFPLFTLAFLIVYFYFPLLERNLFLLATGFMVGFHCISTWVDTNKQQPDLQKVGFFFAWCFLPTANLVFLGWLITTLLNVSSQKYFQSIYNYSVYHFELLQQAATPLWQELIALIN